MFWKGFVAFVLVFILIVLIALYSEEQTLFKWCGGGIKIENATGIYNSTE